MAWLPRSPTVGGQLFVEAASYGGVTKPVLRLGWCYGLMPWIAERAILGAVGFSFGGYLSCASALCAASYGSVLRSGLELPLQGRKPSRIAQSVPSDCNVAIASN